MPRKKKDNTEPLADEPKPQGPWRSGTDLKDPKTSLYRWPQAIFPGEPEFFPAVTTILESISGGMRFAEAYFTAEAVIECGKAAKTKTPMRVWHDMGGEDGTGGMVEVRAVEILTNSLDPNYWGNDNEGFKWVQFAGMREMTRRANRGSIVHDAIEDWAYGQRVTYQEIPEYCQTLIQARGFTIAVDYVQEYVAQVLLWLEKHVVEVIAAESVVISRRWGYAGTLDLICKLRDLDIEHDPEDVFLIDFKASKGPQPVHEYQAAAYFFADWVGVRGTDELIKMPKCRHAINVYVQPDKVMPKHWQRIAHPEGRKSPLTCPPMKFFVHTRQIWHDTENETKGRYKAVKVVKVAVPKAKPKGRSKAEPKPLASEQAAAEFVEGQTALALDPVVQ